MVDLSSLNPAERDVLELLARGHTAKSIAALTGHSVGAVNERLRDARRKTGIGSSRELARLLAQENRDEQIGLALPEFSVSDGLDAHRSRRLMLKGLAVILPITIAVALVAFGQQQPAQPAASRPAALPLFPNPEVMARERLASETRDPAWAAATEATLFREYRPIAGLDQTSLGVRCGATMCEVSARFLPGDSAARNRTLRGLQGWPLAERLGKVGLVNGLQSFGSSKKSKEQTFAAFWARKDAGKPVSAAS